MKNATRRANSYFFPPTSPLVSHASNAATARKSAIPGSASTHDRARSSIPRRARASPSAHGSTRAGSTNFPPDRLPPGGVQSRGERETDVLTHPADAASMHAGLDDNVIHGFARHRTRKAEVCRSRLHLRLDEHTHGVENPSNLLNRLVVTLRLHHRHGPRLLPKLSADGPDGLAKPPGVRRTKGNFGDPNLGLHGESCRRHAVEVCARGASVVGHPRILPFPGDGLDLRARPARSCEELS